ncbi:MAG: phage terminase small subunit P27 family [Candidatus Marinimicrobia bacterium]|nr:phage terminase small subunit P27 family [Candidatus Neomarinimicrobiota bacterium]
MPDVCQLRPPRHLGRFGKSLWRTYAGKLVELRVLTAIDWPAWEALCLAYDRMREAGADITRHKGRVYVKNGIARLRPEVRIEAEARKEFRLYCTEFGLTPSSWSGVAASVAEGKQAAVPMNPDQRDPDKAMPEGPLSDVEYLDTPATRH